MVLNCKFDPSVPKFSGTLDRHSILLGYSLPCPDAAPKASLPLVTCWLLSAPACPIIYPSYAQNSILLLGQVPCSLLHYRCSLFLGCWHQASPQFKTSKNVSSPLLSFWLSLISRRLPESRPCMPILPDDVWSAGLCFSFLSQSSAGSWRRSYD